MYNTFTKLVNTGVLPILDYSAGVWGGKEFKKILDVQARAMRFFLGVNKFAPILGIEGEMGWEPAEIRKRQMLTFWNRIIGMDDSLLTRKIFEQDYDICKAN